MIILLSLVLFATTTSSLSNPIFETPSNGGKIWALLIAGSNGYWNYRHQADVSHAYQILHKQGIPDENIVVMMYDDVANDSSNPLPGKLINNPNGHDVYRGVVKDYTGNDVNKKNFLNILQGDKAAMKKIGSGKVIASGPNDHVFVNFVDHGTTGAVCIIDDMLYADELINALKTMAKNKQFKKMLLYIEACEAGSMFQNLLPKNIEILASTASNADESSWGCYCDDPTFATCLGDLYSVTWMEHLDNISPKEERQETILEEYKYVKKHVNLSHVMLYGDKKHLNHDKVRTFLGIHKNKAESTELSQYSSELSALPSREIGIKTLRNQIKSSSTNTERTKLTTKLEYIEKMRLMIDNIVTSIAHTVSHGNEVTLSNILDKRYPVTWEVMPCYKNLVQQFTHKCVNPFKNPYVNRYLYTLLNMCSIDVRKERVISAFNSMCDAQLLTATGIV